MSSFASDVIIVYYKNYKPCYHGFVLQVFLNSVYCFLSNFITIYLNASQFDLCARFQSFKIHVVTMVTRLKLINAGVN